MGNRFLSSDEKLLRDGLFSDVTVKCGDRTWNLHKNILCTRSVWFERALTGRFLEAQTGVIEIQNFTPDAVDWVIRYIYTGVCDIPSLKPSRDTKTHFVTCYEVYTVADYFSLTPLATIALKTLTAEFDAKLGPIQRQYESSSDWLPELFEAIRLVYGCGDSASPPPINDLSLTPIHRAFLSFVHTARFYFLQNTEFNRFLDEEAPEFALALFRAMRTAGDFLVWPPAPQCSFCGMRPSRGDKTYYTHLAIETPKLMASCSTCAVKKDLPSPMTNWSLKKNPVEGSPAAPGTVWGLSSSDNAAG
ncbi:POZ domain-containing protein [Canariomyces notabilis]|uniref:POZ domain-containing protein n=1 Tax=Canariomyces notabilis TaxID=2074819 RepID=A0AAN6YSV6_9PEZI|nr:POZ domain-containing protein [Canariomyces arenarius]